MSAQAAFIRLVGFLGQIDANTPSRDKPVFWLGAGCSLHDGIPLNAQLLLDVLPKNAPTWGSPQFRFDEFVETFGDGTQRANLFLPHVDKPLLPDSPYHDFVKVLAAGYSDVVITFNIDDLLERALDESGLREFKDYLVVKVPELNVMAAVSQITKEGSPRIRIVKLHGDAKGGFNYMTSKEIIEFPAQIRETVKTMSTRPAVVCGYGFSDLNVLGAFSRDKSAFFFVNPYFPNNTITLSIMKTRGSQANFIDDQMGDFKTFMNDLVIGLCL